MALMDFFTKAKPERSITDAPVQPQVMYLNSGLAVALVKWDDKIAAAQAMRHPIVHRAMDKIASSVQQVRFLVQEDPYATASERRDKATQRNYIQTVLNSPNDEMAAPQFRYWMGLVYAAYGRVPMRVTTRAMDPLVANAIYPLDAAYVYAKQNGRGQITHYEYGQGDTKETYPSLTTYRQAPTPGGFAMQLWRPGLKGYQHKDDANNVLQSIGLPAQVIKSLLLRTIATAEGHPNVRYLVTCEKTLTDPQKEALKKHLNEDHGPGGPDAGKVPILQNVGNIQIHTLDNDLSDIHTKMPSDDMARLIFGAFGVPIALAGMGAADAAKFASNYAESRTAFWQDTIVPSYVSPIAEGLTRALCPAGLVVVPDLDTVPAMMHARLAGMKELKDVTFLTTTEKRALFGYEQTAALPEAQAAPASAAGARPNEAQNDD